MRVLVTGSSGMVGSALCAALQARGDEVVRVSRKAADSPGVLGWDMRTPLDERRLAAVDAVVHLAGENLAAHRWTEAFKLEIRESRTLPTRFLAEAIARMEHPPAVFVSTSAVGYYGSAGSAACTEDHPAGQGFLAGVCVAWEAAAQHAASARTRVICARFGVVLDPAGGALAKMVLPTLLGLGGPLGSGQQIWSWIALSDLVAALLWLLDEPGASGPYNLTAPEPVSQGSLARALARVLKRPALLPAPAFALRLLLGEMADEMLLASTNAPPQRLLREGFSFRACHLEEALRHLFTSRQ